MNCPLAYEDAAYVLGALSPTERLDFERHLADCPDCTRAVRELAGLPGLLGRVEASVLEGPQPDAPPPETLLPALSREVRRGRRQRSLAVAGLAAAVTAVVAVAVPVAVSQGGHVDTAGPSVSASSTTPGAASRPMTPVGDVPVQASVAMEQVAWGTKLLLTCTYEPGSVDFHLPDAVDYTLVVRTRQGKTEQVGSWRSVSGTTMRVTAATSATRSAIDSVEVRTTDGRVVLRLAA
jgi:hypothetical protein